MRVIFYLTSNSRNVRLPHTMASNSVSGSNSFQLWERLCWSCRRFFLHPYVLRKDNSNPCFAAVDIQGKPVILLWLWSVTAGNPRLMWTHDDSTWLMTWRCMRVLKRVCCHKCLKKPRKLIRSCLLWGVGHFRTGIFCGSIAYTLLLQPTGPSFFIFWKSLASSGSVWDQNHIVWGITTWDDLFKDFPD